MKHFYSKSPQRQPLSLKKQYKMYTLISLCNYCTDRDYCGHTVVVGATSPFPTAGNFPQPETSDRPSQKSNFNHKSLIILKTVPRRYQIKACDVHYTNSLFCQHKNGKKFLTVQNFVYRQTIFQTTKQNTNFLLIF